MRKFRTMSAQPATDYYAWQIEVYLENFLSLGYNGNYIDVIGAIKGGMVPDSWLRLQQAYPYVRFFFYRDELEGNNYPPAVQAHVLQKHWKSHPELEQEAIFFHDCDFIFTRHFDFKPYLIDDNWYFSNCDHYIGADYIESKGVNDKGENILDGMAAVVGICACKIRANRGRSGGAQKLMKNVTEEYWAEVERDSIYLYNWLLQNKDDYEKTDIQIWTASMWSELWNAWKRGVNVMIPSEFDFAWATDHIARWDEKAFFHNAGVTEKGEMFYKSDYMDKLPFLEELDLADNRCSIKYWGAVKKVGAGSVLL